MQNLLRKYKTYILIFILVFIGLPFVFLYGNPSTGKRGQSDYFTDGTIATVGGVPLQASRYRQALDVAAQRRAASGGKRPTYEEMDADGTAQEILQQLIDSTLIGIQEQTRKFNVRDEYVDQQMKEWPQFQDDSGNFDAELWNAWVSERDDIDWNAYRNDVKTSLSRQLYLGTVLAASGRVLDSEIDRGLEDDATKIEVKFAKIEPPVTPTDEEIQAQYDDNPDKYKKPDTHVVDFVSISLQPEVPQLAFDLVKQAREGADFAALADAQVEEGPKNGGDMGWQTPREDELEFRKPLFDLAVGEVSDPVPGPGGFFIYKVEEERFQEPEQEEAPEESPEEPAEDEPAAAEPAEAESTEAEPAEGAPEEETPRVREVHARQIILRVALPEAEKAEREEKAQRIADKAKELGGLAAAAAEFGLDVTRTGRFTKESDEIENVLRTDVFRFRTAFEETKEETPYPVVAGREDIYVAQVVETEEGAVPPLDEIREEVVENTITAIKQTDEYKSKVDDYAAKIRARATALTQIAERFPELNAEVRESEPFTRKDFIIKARESAAPMTQQPQKPVYLQGSQVYDALRDKEPGAMAGPVKGFLGDSYFVELVQRIAPTEEEKKDWPEKREELRDRQMRIAENQLLEDFCADLRERMLTQIPVQIDEVALDDILGRNRSSEEEGTEDAADATAETGESTPEDAAAQADDAPAAEEAAPAEDKAAE